MSQKMLLWIIFVLNLSLPDSIGFDNLALNKIANQSSTWPHSNTSRAVDGDLSQSWPNLAVTNFENTVWWYVDLGVPCNIHNITIYYRAENFPEAFRNRFAGFSLYISDTGQTTKGGFNCDVNSTYPPVIFPIVCMRAGRFVSIYNQIPSSDPSASGAVLELGEVQVFGCPSAAMYGLNCNIPCSDKCKNRLCNILSGNCFFCFDGYEGIDCNQPCSAGYYGEGCNHKCSTNCANPTCNNVNGACVGGCNPGWKGIRCDQSCENGKYGRGCSNSCGFCQVQPCNKENGSCAACVSGYYPPLCQTQCMAGLYGQDCQQQCSWNCKNNVTCNYNNGYCSQGCADGWRNSFCSSTCPTGTYGSGCASRCSNKCRNGAICHHVTGTCDHGCRDGYYGLKCTEACSGNCKENAVCDGLTGICRDGCAAGWESQTCSKVCDSGEYGENCALGCGNCKDGTTCNRASGHCESGCGPGYTGQLCRTACSAGLYGENCSNKCSGNCLNSAPCNVKTGECDGECAAGYTGTKCDKKCQVGFYGFQCKGVCSMNCFCNDTCNYVNGSCPRGCISGWMTDTCTQKSQKSSATLDSQDSQLGVGIAIGIGISAVLIIAVILGRLVFRRCRNTENKPESTKEPGVIYSNDALSADQLNNSAKNDDYQELSQIPDTNPQYDVLSPNAK